MYLPISALHVGSIIVSTCGEEIESLQSKCWWLLICRISTFRLSTIISKCSDSLESLRFVDVRCQF
jgi:hypothetical protein